jgi:hypothetical protein
VNDPHARAERAHLHPRGSSQGGLRQYNERVVLQAIRLHGALPGAEIARLTGLTAQTVSMITKSLIDDGYLRKGEPVRGKVGQPSVPLSLAPDKALISDDLPAPLSPMTARISPERSSKSLPSRAVTEP